MRLKARSRVQQRGVRLPFGDMSEVERVARRQPFDSAVRERAKKKARCDATHSNGSKREKNRLPLGDVSKLGRVAMRQPFDYGV